MGRRGQPVTFGITRAAELVSASEKLTAQHSDTLARAITELRAVGDIESAEARGIRRPHQRVATAQAITRMDDLERELTELRTATEAEVRSIRASAAAEIRQARDSANRDISAARDHAARQVADAEERAEQAEQDATRARQAETAAVVRAEYAQAAAADETARIRADHQHALDQLTTATNARITALEETHDALRIRAERAESDLDTARAENQRLAKQLTQASSTDTEAAPSGTPSPRPRTPSRTKKTPATQTPHPEA